MSVLAGILYKWDINDRWVADWVKHRDPDGQVKDILMDADETLSSEKVDLILKTHPKLSDLPKSIDPTHPDWMKIFNMIYPLNNKEAVAKFNNFVKNCSGGWVQGFLSEINFIYNGHEMYTLEKSSEIQQSIIQLYDGQEVISDAGFLAFDSLFRVFSLNTTEIKNKKRVETLYTNPYTYMSTDSSSPTIPPIQIKDILTKQLELMNNFFELL